MLTFEQKLHEKLQLAGRPKALQPFWHWAGGWPLSTGFLTSAPSLPCGPLGLSIASLSPLASLLPTGSLLLSKSDNVSPVQYLSGQSERSEAHDSKNGFVRSFCGFRAKSGEFGFLPAVNR